MALRRNALEFRLFDSSHDDSWLAAASSQSYAGVTGQPPARAFVVNDGPQYIGDAIADDITTTTTINVGGTLNSLIDHNGDLDYIAVQLVAGQTYTFSLDGISQPDAYIELRNSAGALVAEDDDGGIITDSFLMFNATQTGTYYIVARGFLPSDVGTYSLTVEAIATGQTSPTTFNPNSLPFFSWEEAAIQISRNGAGWMSDFGEGAVITYAYRATAPGAMPDDTAGFSTFTAAQILATELALAAWASVANITFVRVNDGSGYSNNATMLFGNYSSGAAGAAAFAYLPRYADTSAAGVEGDIWVNISQTDNQNPSLGTYGFQTILHEIGHALGLSHPGDYNAGGGGGPITYPGSADFYGDTTMFTIMSYFTASQTGGLYNTYASLPQVFDITAIQRLYGANMTTRSGDTTYGFNSNTGVTEYTITSASQQSVFTVWDGGGNDTLDFSGYTVGGTIDLRQESFSSVGPRIGGTQIARFNVTIAHGVVIENAIGGSGDDIIIGNDANNTLDGRGGFDSLSGGLGDDTYIANNTDSITESVNGGTDTVFSNSTFTLSTNVENLTLTGAAVSNGTGNASNNAITGNEQNNTLSGLDGDDTLLGAGGADILQGGNNNDHLDGGAGADNMQGGDGNDTYVVDDAGDTVTEGASQGTDTVTSSVTFTLGANVENLTLTGSANLNGTGNASNNTLIGNSGANTLDGGAGADAMFGGGGNDTYIVDDAGDTVTEGASAGTDVVQTSVTFSLTANIENLTLTGGGAINGFGNILNNIITGNGAANQLNGFDGNDTLDGGAGADNMFGGNGDDTYYVDNVGDQTTEGSALGGTDIVFSSVNRNLTANIENLTLTGTADLTGSGNTLNNVITGNSGANTLYGFDGNDTLNGGTGADTLFGANGDDIYYVDNVNDITVEGSPTGGIDTVFSSIDRNLNANFENLTLIGTAQYGYGNVLNNVMTGNASSNSLYGFDGNDTLDGGAGADFMFGANGDDTYIVDNAGDVTSETSPSGGVDTVISSVTRNLTANLENLTLSGTADITGAGNALNNVIIGNSGANTLYGLDGADTLDGGLGADTLQGGTGADNYVFSTALGGGNIDSVVGFNAVDDTIVLSNAIFTGLSVGTLAASAFVIGAAAADADDRIIYNSATGALFFDADGNGGGVAVQFATLTAGLALTNSDFIVSGP